MSKKLIRFFKGVLLPEIHSHIIKSTYISVEELDIFLKDYSNFTGSCADKDNSENMKELVELSIYFGQKIGCDVDYPQDKLDNDINLNFNR